MQPLDYQTPSAQCKAAVVRQAKWLTISACLSVCAAGVCILLMRPVSAAVHNADAGIAVAFVSSLFALIGWLLAVLGVIRCVTGMRRCDNKGKLWIMLMICGAVVASPLLVLGILWLVVPPVPRAVLPLVMAVDPNGKRR